MNGYQIQNLIIGLLFWAFITTSGVFFMRNYQDDKESTSYNNQHNQKSATVLWFIDTKNNKKLYFKLKNAGYNTDFSYTYSDAKLITNLRIGPYSTKNKTEKIMFKITKDFNIKASLISILSTESK